MKLNTFLLIACVIYGLFGLGRLFASAQIFALQGLKVDATGQLMARTKGAALIGYGVIFWFARSAETSSPALRAILLGNVTYIILEIILLVRGELPSGKIVAALPSLGVEILLLVGFAYYYFKG